MGGVRAEPAASGRGVRPPVRYLRVGIRQQREVHHEGGQAGVADLATAYDACEQCLARAEPHLGAEQVYDAGPLGRLEQRPRLGRVARERLLAEHMLARGDRIVRDRGMAVGRSRDRDRVDAVDRERLR